MLTWVLCLLWFAFQNLQEKALREEKEMQERRRGGEGNVGEEKGSIWKYLQNEHVVDQFTILLLGILYYCKMRIHYGTAQINW